MAEDTLNPEQDLLVETRNQIRKLVAEIADLAESDIQPNEFHAEFLSRAVAAVAASGGALWLLDAKGSLRLQHQVEFRQTGLMDRGARTAPHDALLGWLFQTGQPQIIPPQVAVEGVPNAANPTPFALICAPIVVDRKTVGLVEVLMDPNRKAAGQRSTLRFVGDLSDLAGSYLKNRQSRQLVSQQRMWNSLENFTHAVHNSLDLKETCYAAANEGKRLIGCDRLSVAMKLGGHSKVMVEAVSGQELVEQRSNLIRELTRLCKLVIQSGEDLVYSGQTETFPPDIRDALEIYVDESGSKALVVTLLHKPVEEDPKDPKPKDKVPFGCLVAEQIGDDMPMTDAHSKLEVVAKHASTALWNAQEHHKIFLLPVLKAVGSPWRFFRGRTLAKVLAVLGAILGVIAIMAFVPWTLTIEGKGSLLTEARRNTYAPVAGIVEKVHVDHAQKVNAGDLLVEMDSPELQKEYKRLTGEFNNANSQIVSLQVQHQKARLEERQQIFGQIREAEIKAESTARQLKILDEQFALMQVRAPVSGIVTTWEPKKELADRPVEIGTPLIAVADTEGAFILQVEIPDDDMGPVLAAKARLDAAIAAGTKPKDAMLPAYFVFATDPEHRYVGHVLRIASKAETVEGKHVNKADVGFDPSVLDRYRQMTNSDPRFGAEVRARIDCGKARLAYVLLRDIIQVWHETVMFRWPFLR